jgi:RimJ/RimL family protein N-acetyltransferase
MRYVDEAKKTLRLGFVIVDDTRRGRGYGKEMIRLSLRYAFDCFGAETVNLGVFENNPAAWQCYRAAGFRDVPQKEKFVCHVCGEDWTVTELEMTKEEWLCQNNK